MEIDIIASRDTMHKTGGIWYFQPTPVECIEVSADKMEKVNGEFIITATLEYSPGYPPPRTMDHDNPGFSDPGEGPSAELCIGQEYLSLTLEEEEGIIDQVCNDERPSVYMDEYNGAPHPDTVKAEIARLEAVPLSFYVSAKPSLPWIAWFARKRFLYLESIGRVPRFLTESPRTGKSDS